MMAKKQDPQIEWGFHAVIPRLVRTNYEKLTPVQKWLYVCLKDLCGEHGTCYRALRVLATETGISIGMLSESVRCLHDAGLIHAEKKRRNNNPTAKEVWHITIVDIWQANAKEHPTKRSQNEHYKEGNVHTVNNNVHIANDNDAKRSPAEQQCSHSETEEVSLTSINIEAVSQSSNIVATSAEDRTHAAITDLHEWKTASGKTRAITKDMIASHSQRLSEDDFDTHELEMGVINELIHAGEEDDVPTVKMPVVNKPSTSDQLVNNRAQSQTSLSSQGTLQANSGNVIKTPDAGVPLSSVVDPNSGQDDAASGQAIPVLGTTPAQRAGAVTSHSPSVSTGAVQAAASVDKMSAVDHVNGVNKAITKRRAKKAVTQAKVPAITLTEQQQAFWALWCAVWFNAEITPDLTETAYKHIVKLAPYITTQEDMDSLEKYARKRLLEQSGISRREVQLGNCVNCYQSWKQTQQRKPEAGGPVLGGYYLLGEAM